MPSETKNEGAPESTPAPEPLQAQAAIPTTTTTTTTATTAPPPPTPTTTAAPQSSPPPTQSAPTLATITETAGEIPARLWALSARALSWLERRFWSPAAALSPAAAATLLWRRGNDLLLRAYVRAVPSEQNRLFILTVMIGAVCGFAAVVFHIGIKFAETHLIDRALGASGYWWIPLTLLTPALGALLCGAALQYLFPAARGSGIPQVKVVYAINSGRLRLRDSVAKFFIGILQIGTGSSLGREGPTVHICAGLAAALGKLFALSPPNVRRLIPVGAAAGIAAAFNAPIAAVTFTTEEIVGDLDQTVLSGVVVAAALAAVIERTVLGEQPVFEIVKSYELTHMTSLLIYAALGVVAAAVSHVFVRGLLSMRLAFRNMRAVPGWAQPALGGLVTGAVAVAIFAALRAQGVTGGGYETLNDALNGKVVAHAMLALCAAKIIATLFSYSSGGAGGIFAPTLFIGGMLGGAFSFFDSWGLGHTDTQVGAFVVVGMGAVFAGVIRAPITSFLIIFEMTNGYGLILPLMIANTTSYVLARRWHKRPVYEALIEQDGVKLPHKSSAATVLSSLRVDQAMTHRTKLVTLTAATTVRSALDAVTGKGVTAFPVVDLDDAFAGLVTEAKLRRLLAERHGDEPLRDHLRARETLRPEQPLLDAVARMNKLGVRQMAVVDGAQQHRLVGMFAMSDVFRAHAHAHAEGQPPDLHESPVTDSSGGGARDGDVRLDDATRPASTSLDTNPRGIPVVDPPKEGGGDGGAGGGAGGGGA